jgi:Carbohydrate esterase, sialic acid-specific acetylesterase
MGFDRRSWLVLVLVLATFASDASAARQRLTTGPDGFVLAGQSNMVGASTQYEDETTGRVTSPAPNGLESFVFRARADNVWTLANEFPCADSQCFGSACAYPPNRTVAVHPQSTDTGSGTCVCTCGVHLRSDVGDAGRGSPWPTFAELWMQRGRQAMFVSTALGGQCLVAATSPPQPTWDPDAIDCAEVAPLAIGQAAPEPTRPGELFCRMIQAVQTSNVATLRAVLWSQGECEATAGIDYATYKAALERFADAVWDRLGVPVIAAPISRHSRIDECDQHPNLVTISQATMDAAQDHPYIMLGPRSDNLELESDCAHIHDVRTLGQRWYQAVMDAGVAP